MDGIDTHLFIDIIVSEGAQLMGPIVCVDNETFEFYTCRSGKRVQICTSDEYLSCTTAKEYLALLGMADLIPALFPEKAQVAGQDNDDAQVVTV